MATAADVPPVIAVFGPTGSGKTDVAVEIAARLGTRVVNADPAQCYDGLPILTNKPTDEHDARAPHELVGCWPLSCVATVAEFSRLAHGAVDQLVEATGHAVVCGGSGLYVRAALSMLEFGSIPGAVEEGIADEALRARLDTEWELDAGASLHSRLMAADPDLAARIPRGDRKRLVRAVELLDRGSSVAPGGGSIWDAPYRHPTTNIGLDVDRSAVHARIARRTTAMFDDGVLDEVARVVGVDGRERERLSATSLRIHGLSDCLAVLDGSVTAEDARDQLVIRTRQYVKRQDTWARRWPGLWRIRVDLDAEDSGVEVTRVGTLVLARAHEHVSGVREARAT